MKFLTTYRNQIIELCKKYNVNQLHAFGSIIRPNFSTTSDIDLLVEFKEVPLKAYADNYFDFIYKLEELFHREVDLIDSKAVTNPYFKEEVERSKVLVYG